MVQDQQSQQGPQPADDGTSDQTQTNDSSTQQPRRIDWMQISTVIAALAASVGLAFSGWTSYYSVRTAQAQLDQSREDADRELRQQAVQVSTWTQIDGTNAPRGEPGKITGFVMNRSLDPVAQVIIGITTEADIGVVNERAHNFTLDLGELPPCSKVTIPAEVVHAVGIRTEVNYRIVGVSLVDVYGQRWTRLASGPLLPIKEASAKDTDGSIQYQMAINKALFGNMNVSGASGTPGAGNSPVDAPEPLKDCGTDK
ncbi:hypothetical protein OG585_52535 (plasmid) [Streptomyces sp. NBC_01340]|uniref:hypothetical protein n=1 Tax=Streptomyces sp. NBC_01340 TaxID=2903830 RepID=UPI002E15C21E|nr:hypothetical protein OG585_52535 [Streptomyces sp. NBC_01340]